MVDFNTCLKTTSEFVLLCVLTTSRFSICHSDQIAAPGFSNHDLIFYAPYKLKSQKSKCKIFMQCDFSKINKLKLLSEALNIDWFKLNLVNNIDDEVAIFSSLIIELHI